MLELHPPLKKITIRRAPAQLPAFSGGACANPDEQEGENWEGPTLPTPVCVPANVVCHMAKLQHSMDEMLHLQGVYF